MCFSLFVNYGTSETFLQLLYHFLLCRLSWNPRSRNSSFFFSIIFIWSKSLVVQVSDLSNFQNSRHWNMTNLFKFLLFCLWKLVVKLIDFVTYYVCGYQICLQCLTLICFSDTEKKLLQSKLRKASTSAKSIDISISPLIKRDMSTSTEDLGKINLWQLKKNFNNGLNKKYGGQWSLAQRLIFLT